MEKMLPIGIERFEEIRENGYYYVDKTGLIKELMNNMGKANLFTRPRRFGKSLNMNMFKCFFEIGCKESLFDGLEIAKETEICEKFMGKFPVISISMKEAESNNFAGARAAICAIIANEALRFRYLLESDVLDEVDKAKYRNLIRINSDSRSGEFLMSDDVLNRSLWTLSELLKKHHGKEVILLIDEYDVPLAKANEAGYYDEMVLLIRKLFGSALKTNDSLAFAVLIGCLRIAKESIFTGLNNFNIFSITDDSMDEYFGFTDKEVKDMLKYYDLEENYDIVKEWYDGYKFGNTEVYCPWDVICYCSKHRRNKKRPPENYWLNTSGNDIVKHFIERMDDAAEDNFALTKAEMERLVNGETVQKKICQELTYKELYSSSENIWSALFMTGYLTQRGVLTGERVELAIPNREIRNIFTNQILMLFKKQVAKDGSTLRSFCEALYHGEVEKAETFFNAYLEKTISIRDTFVKKPTKENFYHGILLGILEYKAGWYVTSNRESGDGFTDIMVIIDDSDTAILIEVKYAEGSLEAACRKALEQIDVNHYTESLRFSDIHKVLKYGIACKRKKCKVVLEKEILEYEEGEER